MLTPRQLLDFALFKYRAGHVAEAESLYHQVLALEPHQPDALHALGQIAGERGDFKTAQELIQRAVTLRPERVHYLVNLANCLTELGRADEAIAACETILSREPMLMEAHYSLGNARAQRADHEGAVSAYWQALQLRPGFGEGYANLGLSLVALGRLDESIAAYETGLRLAPGSSILANNLATSLKNRGDLDASIQLLRTIVAAQPGNAAAWSNLLFNLYFHPASDADRLNAEFRAWRQTLASFTALPIHHEQDRSPDRPLRIGYVSPDLHGRHPLGRHFLPVFLAHDRAQFAPVCYSEIAASDEVQNQFRTHAALWRNTGGLTDDALAAQIHADRIDILVDLAVHSGNNRLPVFARQPAPVQATWLGYAGSTGLDTVACRLTDARIDPIDSPTRYGTETPVHLPDGWFCYAPPTEAPPPSPSPAAARGYVTFGSLNSFSKLNPRQLSLWARILREVPTSRLVMIAPPGRAREQVLSVFSGEGVSAPRIEFLDTCPLAEHWARFAQMDIALDSFPYNGMVTTADALWMGVPVVTLSGTLPISRAALSVLAAVGLPELAALTPNDYVRFATGLARDRTRLTSLRSSLRTKMQSSPLTDAARFTRHLEVAFRTMWRRWCAMPS